MTLYLASCLLVFTLVMIMVISDPLLIHNYSLTKIIFTSLIWPLALVILIAATFITMRKNSKGIK